jgi:hypothetical protein
MALQAPVLCMLFLMITFGFFGTSVLALAFWRWIRLRFASCCRLSSVDAYLRGRPRFLGALELCSIMLYGGVCFKVLVVLSPPGTEKCLITQISYRWCLWGDDVKACTQRTIVNVWWQVQLYN